ncbi:Ubiquitin carboxyl-terminal hydrolase 14 [Papilio machaon]|uniref:ubiquitinyl hydrolase 1 n=1 Tax=Papilio machaon TaxID=76193 RepID=A0A0N1IQC2_PAPMA|nr:Ubiquitin carboxyl-terminal hydrolase 14 [Papilio machaon]
MASVELLTPHLPKIKIPAPQQIVYKDECVYSFDNPESETGLYVSLTSFLGFGRNYVEQYFQKTGNPVFLHIQREKKPIPEPEVTGDGPEKKITRLAIGVEGGFEPDIGKPKYTYTDHYNIVVLPGFYTYPWPDPSLPEVIKKSVQAIINAESPFKMAEMAALQGTWDGERREVSVHAVNLQQLDNNVKIPPSGWKCDKCELTTNLWLNLTDGSILCGRRFFDGSGGNDHAVEHYRETGFPLAVKLGTITPDGKGDVFSYAEDDMVEDPFLADHLKHFGINVQQLQKVMFRMPDFIRRFVEGAPEIFSTFPEDPANDFNVQTAKLGVGLLSGRYSFPEVGGMQRGVSPHMYRQLVGRGHPEFMSKRQQDAHEFYLHLLTLIEEHVRIDPSQIVRPQIPFSACLESFMREETLEQFFSTAVNEKVTAQKITRLATFPDYLLIQLKKFTIKEDWTPAKLDVAVDMPWEVDLSCLRGRGPQPDETLLPDSSPQAAPPQYDETVLAQLLDMGFPVEACKRALYYTGNTGLEPASNWLMEHLTDWDFANKFEPPGSQPSGGASVAVDEASVANIISMGFTRPQAEKALRATEGDVGRALDWIFSRADQLDSEEEAPPREDRTLGCRDGPEKYKLIAFISHMGTSTMVGHYVCHVLHEGRWVIFNDNKVLYNTFHLCQSLLFHWVSYEVKTQKYKLIAFISHMGTSTMVGHYVCHVLHEGRWVIFNDNKVALSENPPKDLGYLYLYERL